MRYVTGLFFMPHPVYVTCANIIMHRIDKKQYKTDYSA